MLKILPVIVLCIISQSCMVNRYAMEDMNCHDSWGGTVYELKHGKELVGTVFDKARMTFPGPQFEIRFTPTLEEILIADSIICENIPSIVGLAKNYSGNYYLRSRNRLKRYFRQYGLFCQSAGSSSQPCAFHMQSTLQTAPFLQSDNHNA